MSFLSKGRSTAVVEEVTYGAAAPTFLDTNYIDYTGADISTAIEQLERAVMRDSMVDLAPVLGQETSSGSITVEISGDNATTGVNGHLLYKNGIGKSITDTVATTAAALSTVSLVKVASATGITEGQILKVNLTGGDEYVSVVSVVGTDVTVSPDLSTAPVLGDAVKGLQTYILPRPADTVKSLAVREHLKPTTGNTIDYDYLGVMVSDVALAYPVGNIATSAFTIAGAGFVTNTPGSSVTLPCTIATPVVGKNATLTVMGTAYNAQDLSINITTDMTDINSITTDGISNKLGTKKTVTGSFKKEYNGLTDFNAFKAGTTGSLMLQVRDGGKTSPMIQVVYLPSIKFTEVTRSEDAGILYDNITFQAMSIDCVGNEKALSLAFA